MLVGPALYLLLCTPEVIAGQFEDHWYDGKAELSGYSLTVSRYGEERQGRAVMITVTEPYSLERQVKSDRPVPADINALKVNLVRDFQTGMYDYNTMLSVFLNDKDFALAKVSFSSAEWCGHVYEEQVVSGGQVHTQRMSYFDGESGTLELPHKSQGAAEDQLFVLLRGLRGEYLAPGEKKSLDVLPSPYWTRLSHTDTEWTEATVFRHPATVSLTVPAGSFDAVEYSIAIGDRKGSVYVENVYPHRVVKWSLSPDVSAELTGSKRLPYWQLHDNGHESYLQELGLPSP